MSRRPEFVFLLQVLALLQLLLPEVAVQQGVAVLIHPVVEALAGDADAAALLSLQLPLVNERPLLSMLTSRSASALLLVLRRGQAAGD